MKKMLFYEKGKPCGHLEYNEAIGTEPATLYIYGVITPEIGWFDDPDTAVLPKNVAEFLKEIPNDKDLNVYFNSPGGEIFSGFAIYSQLKRHGGRKVGYVDGLAASAASLILLACDEIIISAGSNVMIHKVRTSFWRGTSNDFAQVIKRLEKHEEQMIDIYESRAVESVTRE